MLKLIDYVLIIGILCGGLDSINSEKLKCLFRNDDYDLVGTLYECKVTSLDNSFDNMIIDGYTGTHLANKNDKDVKGIWIHLTNTKYIPDGLGSLSNLTALSITISQLVEIRSKDFQGMQNLEYLNLRDNQLTYVPSDAFSSLTKLKEIDMNSNQIIYIGSGAFDRLTNLNKVYLMENICVDNGYNGATAISQMKRDLKVNCVEPISTTTTTTTTQNPMEVELQTLKNEAKEQQQKNEIELNKLRDDLKKEQLENTKVKMNHQEVESRNDQLKSELSALNLNLQHQVNYTKRITIEKKNLIIAVQKNLNQNQQEKIHLINENNVLKNNLTAAKNEWQMKTFRYETLEQKNKELMNEKDALMHDKDALMNDRESLKMKLNNQTSEINELKTHCKHSNEAGGAVDVKLNNINAMMEQLLKESKENKMECNEIIKLRAELVTAKEEQKKEQLEILKVNKEKDALMKKKDALMIYHNALMKDKDQLKKELTEAKATCKINERSLI